MIALTKWLGATWEEGHGVWGCCYAHNFDKPMTEQTLIDPELIRGVKPWEPYCERAVGTPPECCRVYLANGKSFEVVGNYREVAKLAGLRWKCQHCGGAAEVCPHCGAPREP